MAPTLEERRHQRRSGSRPPSNTSIRRDWVERWLSGDEGGAPNEEKQPQQQQTPQQQPQHANVDKRDDADGDGVPDEEESVSDGNSQASVPSQASAPSSPGQTTDAAAPPATEAPPTATFTTPAAPFPTTMEAFPPLTTLEPAPHPTTSPKTSAVPSTAPVPGFVGVPRKGVDNDEPAIVTDGSSLVTSPTTSAATRITTVTQALPVESLAPEQDGQQPYGVDRLRHHDASGGPRRGMSEEAEHALIGVGSIGIFVLLSLLGWFVWKRSMRKTDRRLRRFMLPHQSSPSEKGTRPSMARRVASRIPFLRDRFGPQWVSMDDGGPAVSEKMMYAARAPTPPQRSSRHMPSLVTRFGAGANAPGDPTMVSPLSSSSSSPSPSLRHSPAPGYSPPPSYPSLALHAGGSRFDPHRQTGSTVSFLDQYAAAAALTPREPMTGLSPPPPMLKQSELSRQPSDARDPDHDHVNRLSELSSLSSGFGDGDIIVEPQGAVVRGVPRNGDSLAMSPPTHPQHPPPTPLRRSVLRLSRFSWATMTSRRTAPSDAGEDAVPRDRDTVYTTTSQDSPPRFRSVSSWVGQQTGRVRRAQRRHNDSDRDVLEPSPSDLESARRPAGWDVGDVPPVPGIPAGLGAGGLPPEERVHSSAQDPELARPVGEVMAAAAAAARRGP